MGKYFPVICVFSRDLVVNRTPTWIVKETRYKEIQRNTRGSRKTSVNSVRECHSNRWAIDLHRLISVTVVESLEKRFRLRRVFIITGHSKGMETLHNPLKAWIFIYFFFFWISFQAFFSAMTLITVDRWRSQNQFMSYPHVKIRFISYLNIVIKYLKGEQKPLKFASVIACEIF